jgi:hypothetical protein
MKKFITILITIAAFAAQTQAQVLTADEIVGTWGVVNIQGLSDDVIADSLHADEESKQQIVLFKNMLLDTKFFFDADGHFTFDIPLEEMKVKDGHWQYDEANKSVTIQDWADKDANGEPIMVLTFMRKNNKILVKISEAPIVLEVVME